MHIQEKSNEQFAAIGFIESIRKLEQDADLFLILIKSTLLTLIHNKDKIEKLSKELNNPEEFTLVLDLLAEVSVDNRLTNQEELAKVLAISTINFLFQITRLTSEYPKIFQSYEYTPEMLLEFTEKLLAFANALNRHSKLELLADLTEIVNENLSKYSSLLPLIYTNSSLTEGMKKFNDNLQSFLDYVLNALGMALFCELDRIARDDLQLKGVQAAKNESPIKEHLAKFQSIISSDSYKINLQFDVDYFFTKVESMFEQARNHAGKIDVFIKTFNGDVKLEERSNQAIGKNSHFTPGICFGHSRFWLIASRTQSGHNKYVRNKRTYNDLHSTGASNAIVKHQMNQKSPNQSLLESEVGAISLGQHQTLNRMLLDIMAYFTKCQSTREIQELEVQLMWNYLDQNDKIVGHAIAVTIPADIAAKVTVNDINIGVCSINGYCLLLSFLNDLIKTFYDPKKIISFEASVMQQMPAKMFVFSNTIQDLTKSNKLCTMYSSGQFDSSDEKSLKIGLDLYKSITIKNEKVNSIYMLMLARAIEIFALTKPKVAWMYLLELHKAAPNHMQTYYFYTLYVGIFALCLKDVEVAKLSIAKLSKKSSEEAHLKEIADFCNILCAQVSNISVSNDDMDSTQAILDFLDQSKSWSELLEFLKCQDPNVMLNNYQNKISDLARLLVPFQWLPRFVDQFFNAIKKFEPSTIDNFIQEDFKLLLNRLLEKNKYFMLFLPFGVLNELEDIGNKYPLEHKVRNAPTFNS